MAPESVPRAESQSTTVRRLHHSRTTMAANSGVAPIDSDTDDTDEEVQSEPTLCLRTWRAWDLAQIAKYGCGCGRRLDQDPDTGRRNKQVNATVSAHSIQNACTHLVSRPWSTVGSMLLLFAAGGVLRRLLHEVLQLLPHQVLGWRAAADDRGAAHGMDVLQLPHRLRREIACQSTEEGGEHVLPAELSTRDSVQCASRRVCQLVGGLDDRAACFRSLSVARHKI